MDKKELQKGKLKSVISMLLATEIALFEFEYTLMDNEQDKQACKKLISESKKAQEIVYKVKHVEILTSIFNTFLGNRETYFIGLSHSIVKNVRKWDTQKGFKEFLLLEKQAREQHQSEQQERENYQKIIEQAKKEGKKVEMIFENGKIKPIVVEPPKN